MAKIPEQEKKEKIQEILDRIEGGEALRNILKNIKMSSRTFYEWLQDDEILQKQYACACEVRADEMFDDLLYIADATGNDVVLDKDGNEVVNHNVIQRDRLRVDARKWILSKLNPKKYGDSAKIDLSGELEIKAPTIQIIKPSE